MIKYNYKIKSNYYIQKNNKSSIKLNKYKI